MKNYQVLGRAAQVHAGRVKLNEDQARRRKHLLKPLGGNVYEVVSPIQFKQGEQFGYDGDFPKAMAQEVMTPEEIKAKKAAALKAEKKAKDEEAARKKAEEDAAAVKAKALSDATADLEKVLDAAKKSQKDGSITVTPEDEEKIDAILRDVDTFMSEGDVDSVKQATQKLNELFAGLAGKK